MTEQPNPFEQFLQRYGPEAGEDGPLRFVLEVLGVESVDPWQEGVLKAFGRGERRISIRACHGPGKTALAAWLVIYMLCTRFPQKTVATAPAAAQLEGALVPEVKMWLGKTPEAIQELFDVKSKGIYLQAAPESSFFEARTARQESPEALQGVHSDHVLLIADEASGVPESIYEAAAGSMSGHSATTILLGNPVRSSGFFYDTHNKLKHMWYAIRVSHEDSPRVTDDFVEDIAARYGEESNAFRIRCLGEFPLSDLDTVIPFEFVESAQNRDVIFPRDADVLWGLDVARFGNDRNVLIKRNRVAVLPDIQTWTGTDLMQTAGKVKNEWDETPPSVRPSEILVDEIGLGSGVVDRLRELGLPVRGINVAEQASFNERYTRVRDELWFTAREWLASKNHQLPRCEGGCPRDCPHEDLARELVAVKFDYTSSGKLKVESKSEMKRRGERSPDFADAFVLTFASEPASLVKGSGANSNWATNWNEPIRRNLPTV